MEDYNILKLVFIFVGLFEAIIMGLIPIKSKKCKESPMVLGIANAFAGGVFIAISLMHMMPEQVESYTEFMEERHHHDPYLI